jgi:hypothetical protein
MSYVEKHVEFTDDLSTDLNIKQSNQEQQQKLHRRDTPHHLKNKRIMTKNNDSLTLDVKFIFNQIMKKYLSFLANHVA